MGHVTTKPLMIETHSGVLGHDFHPPPLAAGYVIINQLANEELKRLGTNWLNPYTFYEDSCFISQFYIGQNGVWLSTNHRTIDDLLNEKETSKPIEYNSHNVDVPSQAYVLMRLFDKWIEYADAFKSE